MKERRLGKEAFWYSIFTQIVVETLGLVLTCSMSFCSMCPDLLLLALEHKDYFLCQLCLQLFPDIPEVVTCACLKTFIRSV